MLKNVERKIKGVLPKKRDVIDYGETKILQLLKFVDFFTVEGVFKCTKETIETAKRRSIDEMFWDEFLIRIDHENHTVVQFRYRFMSLARVVLAWLKSNPHAITPEMWEIMKKNPRMGWATSSFKEVVTDLGVTVIEMNQKEETNPGLSNVSPGLSNVKQPQVIYNQALMTMTTLMKSLIDGIRTSDLKSMTAAQRIELANKLAGTLARSFSQYKPNIGVFTQININKSSREELEKINLQYAETQNNE